MRADCSDQYQCTVCMLRCVAKDYYKGLGTTEKRKETRGDSDVTIIPFLDPFIFDTKIPRD